MHRRRTIRAMAGAVGITVALFAGATISCRRAPAADANTLPPTAGPDTVRGIVSVVGSEPRTTVALTTAGGQSIVVRGEAAVDLRSIPHIEVTLFGAFDGTVADGSLPREAPVFVAHTFAVRAVDGTAAVDGVLVRIESGFALQHTNGLLSALRVVPEALHQYVGARIFWVGSLDAAPAAYGVITPYKPDSVTSP